MSRRPIIPTLVTALLTVLAGSAVAQTTDTSPLPVLFDASAGALPAAAIRAAIAGELHCEVVATASDPAAALLIATADDGRTVILRYRVRGELLQRSLPWTDGSSDAIERVALLAQNLVQDQTALLLDSGSAPPTSNALRPAAEPRKPTSAAEAQPPSTRATVALLIEVAFFNDAQLNPSLRRADARGTAGLMPRFEGPVIPNLTFGLSAALEQWEGCMAADELIVRPSNFMDVQLWVRPRWLLGDWELSAPLAIGPSLMEELESTDSQRVAVAMNEPVLQDAYPPDLGIVASAQLAALYWFSEDVGLLLELGVEYHHVTGRQHDGLPLTLDLVQPKAALGVAFTF